ncbi:MAG: PEP-CTERM sorting domain-containing protein [Gemmataceae bacterium]|nr:PEP-CTERM sorting domain-containing protein [Gemmataceae bacterium]
MRHRSRISLALGIAAGLLAGQTVAHGEVVVTTVGSPTFNVVDWHIYTMPTSDEAFDALLPNHSPSRLPHSPPYNSELGTGLANAGFPEREVFSVSEFIAPNSVQLGFTIVPGSNPPTGSAPPDFTSGPIIPNSVLPIEILGDVYRNGVLFQSGALDFTIPKASSADGRSHFIGNFWADTGPASSDLIGMYEYRLTVRDNQNANGYNISAQFNIAPEPGTLSLFGVCIMGLAGYAWRRRRTGGARKIRIGP